MASKPTGRDEPETRTPTLDVAKVHVSEVDDVSDEIVEALGELARALRRFSEPPTAEHVQRIVDSPTTRLLIARDDEGDIVGMLTIACYDLPTGTRVWFEDISAAYRGKGIGRQLVEEALRVARQTAAADAEIIVQPSQAGGLRMAALMGFGPNDEDTRRIRLH